MFQRSSYLKHFKHQLFHTDGFIKFDSLVNLLLCKSETESNLLEPGIKKYGPVYISNTLPLVTLLPAASAIFANNILAPQCCLFLVHCEIDFRNNEAIVILFMVLSPLKIRGTKKCLY